MHRHIGIQLQAERLVPFRIVEIEKAHVIRAGVRALASADAAIVDLAVEALDRVIARKSGAHRLTWSCVALLAKHGHELYADVGKLTLVISLDANPMFCAPACSLIFAHRRNVIFGMARHHTGSAARAPVEIDYHTPLMCHWP